MGTHLEFVRTNLEIVHTLLKFTQAHNINLISWPLPAKSEEIRKNLIPWKRGQFFSKHKITL